MTQIDYSKLRSLTARKLISALIKDGFHLNRETGSHQQYLRPNKGRVTVSFHHPSDTFPPTYFSVNCIKKNLQKESPKRIRLMDLDQESNLSFPLSKSNVNEMLTTLKLPKDIKGSVRTSNLESMLSKTRLSQYKKHF